MNQALLSNVHTHSTFCDGANTPQEMAETAAGLGFSSLGFSSHSPTPFDPTCPGLADVGAYREEITRLKKLFANRMKIACGVEQDYDAPVQKDDYDYVIGSVHYLKAANGAYVAVDGDLADVKKLWKDTFAKDGLDFAKAFFEKTVESVKQYKPDIVGHFDLLVKHNANDLLLNEESAAYRNIALSAVDAVADMVLPYGGIVEVNTGGMARAYRQTPYPAFFILQHLAQRGVRVMINSDSHKTATLTFGFDKALALVQQAGFKSVAQLKDGCFQDIKI